MENTTKFAILKIIKSFAEIANQIVRLVVEILKIWKHLIVLYAGGNAHKTVLNSKFKYFHDFTADFHKTSHIYNF